MVSIKSLIISTIFIGMIFLGCFSYINGLKSSYSVTADLNNFNETQKALNTQTTIINNMSSIIRGLEFESITASLFYTPYAMIKLGWQALLLGYNSIDVTEKVVGELSANLSVGGITLPSWLIPSLIAILVISVLIILIEMFFRWKMSE